MENYKKLLSGSHFVVRNFVSGSQFQWDEFLYVGPMENYKNLLSGSHFVKRVVVNGSQLLLPCSRSISQMYSTVKSGSQFQWEEFL